MIIQDQTVSVRVVKNNINRLREYGYDNIDYGDVVDVGLDYLSHGSKYKVKVKCDYCEKIIHVAYRDYLNYKFDKYSCRSCRQRKTSEYNLSKRQQSLYSRALDFCNENGYELLTPIEKITTSDTRVEYRCPKHGIHETKIYTLITGHGCIECGIEKVHDLSRKDSDIVYNTVLSFGGLLLNKEEYRDWNCKNLRILCGECGEEFITSYGAFRKDGGQLCPKCSQNISKGEHRIKEYLDSKNIDYKMQYRFSDCRTSVPLPFDFYLPNKNVCIEYDGEGHYKPIPHSYGYNAEEEFLKIKDRDAIKTNYCLNNNITLFRIPYWEYENIETILQSKLFT